MDDPATGVFVPDQYRVDKTIDLVVFLRGYDIKRPKAATGVAEYWSSPDHPILKSFLLREEVNKSGKNVILVVPPLGPFAEAGKLTDEGGLRAFLDRVSEGLWRSGPHADLPEAPKVRNLILAEPERFAVADIGDIPWIEIDFGDDVTRARETIMPRLEPCP